jgi:hypothetical protein
MSDELYTHKPLVGTPSVEVQVGSVPDSPTDEPRPLSPTDYTLEPDAEVEPEGRIEADTSQQIFIEQSIQAARTSEGSPEEDRPLSPSEYTLMSQSTGSEELFRMQNQAHTVVDSIPEDVFSVPEPIEPSSVEHVDLLEQVLATEQQYSDEVARDTLMIDSSLPSTTDITHQPPSTTQGTKL